MSEILRFDLSVPMAEQAELVAARTVEQVARNMAFDERAVQQVRLAVIEACINAFEHSGSEERTLYLNCLVYADRLLVVVRDFGKGFDPHAVPEPVIQEKLNRIGSKRGWGLMLIRRMMDEVAFEDSGPGTTLRMVKYLPAEPIAA
jgi:serine/threonine-protein kinase RsbW